MTKGFVKLPYDLLTWEWYDDAGTMKLYIHLLLTANYKDIRWQGHLIKRGQLVTGRKKLAEELHTTEKKIRNQLTRLKATSKVAIKTTNRFSIITVNNYDEYPAKGPAVGPTEGQQRATSKEREEGKEKEVNKLTSKELDMLFKSWGKLDSTAFRDKTGKWQVGYVINKRKELEGKSYEAARDLLETYYQLELKETMEIELMDNKKSKLPEGYC